MIKVHQSVTIWAKGFSVNHVIDKDGRFNEKSRHKKAWLEKFVSHLPDDFLPKDIENYSLRLDFYMDAKMDLDNVLKYTIDGLEEKYGFNDRKIHHIVANKHTINFKKDRYCIKISLTEKLEYECANKIDVPVQFSEDDYQEFWDLATQNK